MSDTSTAAQCRPLLRPRQTRVHKEQEKPVAERKRLRISKNDLFDTNELHGSGVFEGIRFSATDPLKAEIFEQILLADSCSGSMSENTNRGEL